MDESQSSVLVVVLLEYFDFGMQIYFHLKTYLTARVFYSESKSFFFESALSVYVLLEKN